MANIHLRKVALPNKEVLGYRERDGGEKVVILVHGNMNSSKNWDVLIEKMDPTYKIYAIDQRGFGVSSYLEPVTSISDFSDDLKQFVDCLNLNDFVLVGWSLGGPVCMQFVADHSSYCSQLILLASGSTRGYPFFGTDSNGRIDVTKRLKSFEEIKEDEGRTKAVQAAYDRQDKEFIKTVWDSFLYNNNQPSKERYDEYIKECLNQRNLAESYQALNLFNISRVNNGLTEGTNQAKDIDIPVLVIRGTDDLSVTERMTEEILTDLNESIVEYKELQGCGHAPLIDDLDSLLATMEGFIQRKEREVNEINR